MSRIVVALGGNALGNTPDEQKVAVKHAAKALVPLILEGHNLVICHGNGPQVGMINLAFSTASDAGVVPRMPFAECAAMSQGYIGYHLQNEIDAEIEANGMKGIPVITMLTQTIVDENDPAFQNPTKPIGSFYDEETARKLMAETGDTYVEDAGRGWRKVVPSPKPIGIYETISLRTLFYAREVIIAGGGGGIPIVKREHGYEGVDAVIDKDFAAAKLAELIDADYFFILTAVEKVAVNFGKPDQKDLDELSIEDAERYIAEGQFAPGSMLPKVQAAMSYAQAKPGRAAVITSLERAQEALRGQTGTKVVCPNCGI
ncbi:MAG: carbamate kinase [Actinomycetes bacterium]|jgi:carbamate kinase|nr:carbamate kinase [Actinomycetes bacterium]